MELAKIKDFYTRTQLNGEPEPATYRELFGTYSRKRLDTLKASKDWQILSSALDQANTLMIQKELSTLQHKKLKAYSDLLDKGAELLNTDDPDTLFKAQENQRRNLELSVVEDASSWNSSDRNQQDYGDVLEGIIL